MILEFYPVRLYLRFVELEAVRLIRIDATGKKARKAVT